MQQSDHPHPLVPLLCQCWGVCHLDKGGIVTVSVLEMTACWPPTQFLVVRFVAHSTQLPLSPGDDLLAFCVIARFLVHVFLSEVKNSLSLIIPGDAVCYRLGMSCFVFRLMERKCPSPRSLIGSTCQAWSWQQPLFFIL